MTTQSGDRAVSETLGVATLVLLTVVVTASVGISVLFVEEDSGGGIDAGFEFEFFDNQNTLLVTYNTGPELTAANLTVSTATRNVTWAELAQLNGSAIIAPGDLVQLRETNAFGQRVTSGMRFELVYTAGGNATVLDRYNTTASGGG
jgi:hypothetical protein